MGISVNVLFNTYLVRTDKVKYSIIIKPRMFKINIVYDLLVCPYLEYGTANQLIMINYQILLRSCFHGY
jgi:hypothetical protein